MIKVSKFFYEEARRGLLIRNWFLRRKWVYRKERSCFKEAFIKGQDHNKGKLAPLNVNLEEGVVKKIQEMSKNTKISVDELTVIALKRFISSHCDYLNKAPSISLDQ